jgi:hypothetical protein
MYVVSEDALYVPLKKPRIYTRLFATALAAGIFQAFYGRYNPRELEKVLL